MSKTALMSLEDALEQITAQAQMACLPTQDVSTFDALGRVLRKAVRADLNVPASDNSSMDGYAIKHADVLQGWGKADKPLRVTQRIAAGETGQALGSGQAARIFTGAWIPDGADAIVMQEHAQQTPQGDLVLSETVHLGQWIRRQGEDVKLGQEVLPAGTRLSAAALGMAASVGEAHLCVSRRPKVVLFSTGDELVMPGEVLPHAMKPGSIYNSNRFFLKAMLMQLGCEVIDRGILPDDRSATLNAFESAAREGDLILSSGGVSVGEEDHVKPAVQALGELRLWSLSMKPGKPFALGLISVDDPNGVAPASKKVHFMGLPGNPVSSYVTFMVLVRPFLLALQGASVLHPKAYQLQAHFDLKKTDSRREFLRAHLNEHGGLELFGNQSSGVLTSCVWADGLIDNPAGSTIAHGDWVRFLPFADLSL